MPTTVLHHAHCPDGYAAMFAAWQHFGDTATYIPVAYNQPVPDIPPDHNVMIVDFSYDEDTLKALRATRIGRRQRGEHVVVVLDHHASAQRALEALQRQELPGLAIVFDLEESGASLTWKWLQRRRENGGEGLTPHDEALVGAVLENALPTFYKYIRDRDLWRFQLPDSRAVSLAYWACDKTPEAIALFAQALDEAEGYQRIVERGQAMQTYAEALVREQAQRSVWLTLGGYRVPVVNATTLFSEVGEALCQTYPGAAFAAYWMVRKDLQVQWGLRGRAGGVDVSTIAVSFGGGGHAAAAGYVTSQEMALRLLATATAQPEEAPHG